MANGTIKVEAMRLTGAGPGDYETLRAAAGRTCADDG